MARATRQRPCGASPCRARRDRHAGDVRAERGSDRQPHGGHVRGVRLIRDAAARRFRRAAARAAAGPGLARRRGGRVRVRGHTGLAQRVARGREHGARRLRGDLRRRRQLGAGQRHHLAAARVHPAGDARRSRLGGARSPGRLGHRFRRLADRHRADVAGARTRPAALGRRHRLQGACVAAARRDRVSDERGGRVVRARPSGRVRTVR